jgi:glutamate dehydrogenase (NADP+)
MVYPTEPEFEQALHELTTSLGPFLKANPEYQKALDIVQIPERVIQFRVVWEDDQGRPHVNRGYRVQYNSALGPYKGMFASVQISFQCINSYAFQVASVCTPLSTFPS